MVQTTFGHPEPPVPPSDRCPSLGSASRLFSQVWEVLLPSVHHVAQLGCSPLTYCLPQAKAGHSKTEEERVRRGVVADTTSRVTQVQQKDSMGVCVGTGTLSCGHQKPGSPWWKQSVGLQNRTASGIFWSGAWVYPKVQTVPWGTCVSPSLVQLGGMLPTFVLGLG